MVAPEVAPEEGKQWIWKEGWPQPAENEKGNGGGEVNGGHKILLSGNAAEQLWDDTTVVKNGSTDMRKTSEVAEAAAYGDGGGGMVEPKWVV